MPLRTALVAALVLFAFWSNGFVAIGFLLGAEQSTARFDWLGLTVARFGTVSLGATLWLLTAHRRETLDLLRRHGGRVVVCGLLNVITYNLALNYAQQGGVPSPIASLGTALAPLFLMLLGALVLGERLTPGRAFGFLTALTGLVVVAEARGGFSGAGRYGLLLLLLAVAPASFSVYSVLSKPILDRSIPGAAKPMVWTFTVFAVGGLPLAFLLPWHGGPEILALDRGGWTALLFLTLGCTVFGFVIWMRLLGALPASVAGFAVFLNPPLTTLSKKLLATFWPASFQFTIRPLEWIGGAVVLAGVAVALADRLRRQGARA